MKVMRGGDEDEDEDVSRFLPGVWKLRRRSSTGSVGWWDGISLLLGKLPFLASDSARFLKRHGEMVLCQTVKIADESFEFSIVFNV